MKNLEIKKMSIANINGRLTPEEMENIMAGKARTKPVKTESAESGNGGGGWNCAAGIAGGFLAGMASSTGNGVAFALGPVGVTWGFIGGVGGALLGASAAC